MHKMQSGSIESKSLDLFHSFSCHCNHGSISQPDVHQFHRAHNQFQMAKTFLLMFQVPIPLSSLVENQFGYGSRAYTLQFISQQLANACLSPINHPDVLYLPSHSSFGILIALKSASRTLWCQIFLDLIPIPPDTYSSCSICPFFPMIEQLFQLVQSPHPRCCCGKSPRGFASASWFIIYPNLPIQSRPVQSIQLYIYIYICICICHNPCTLWLFNMAMENDHLQWIFPLKMVIFHSYVK